GRLLTLDHADPIQHLGAEASERLQHSQVLRAQDGRSIKRQVEVSRQMALQEEGGNERRAIGGKALVLEWWRRQRFDRPGAEYGDVARRHPQGEGVIIAELHMRRERESDL